MTRTRLARSSRPTTRPRTSRRRARRPAACSSARRPARTASSSSTTTRPTAPARSPTARRRARRRVEVLHRTVREGLGPAYLAGFAHALAAAPGSSSRWTPTSPTTRRTSRACSPRRDGTPTSRSARATSRGGGVRDWGLVRRASSAAAGLVRARRVLGLRVRDLTGGFKCFRREVLEAIDLPSVRSHGYAFQVELTYRALARRVPRRRGADRVPRPRARDVEDVLADRAGGRRARAAAAVGPPRPRARRAHARAVAHALTGLRPAARAADDRAMRLNDLALVQGSAATRATLRRWNAAPWPVLRAWWPGSLAIAAALLLVGLGRRQRHRRPTSRRSPVIGVNASPSVEHVAFLLFRNSLVLALHAMACVAGFIAGSALPAEAERYRGWWRALHDQAGPARDRVRQRRDALLARHPGATCSAAAPRRRRAARGQPPGCCC